MANGLNFQINLDFHHNNVETSVGDINASFVQLNNSITEINNTISQIGDHLEASVNHANANIESVSVGVTNATQNIGNSVLPLRDKLNFNQLVQQFQNIGQGLSGLAAPAVEFEQAMADLQAITGVTGKEFDELSKHARQVGKDSGLGAKASAEAFSILAGQIDVPTDALKELHAQTVLLSQAGALDLQSAADAVAGTLNQFGLEAGEAARVTNVLAAGSRAGGAEVVDLAESFKAAGAAAAAAGLSVEETAGAIEVLASNQTKGAEAGTALRNVVTALQTKLGIDISKTGLTGALEALKGHLSEMADPVERATFLTQTFGRENLTAAQFLIENASAVGEMTAAVTDTNAAQEQAEIRTDTWQAAMQRARARVEDLKIGLSDLTGGLAPMAAMLMEQATGFAQLVPLIGPLDSGFKSMQAAMGGFREGMLSVIPNIRNITSVKGAWAAVQRVLNTALKANPIGAVVAAITALVGIGVVAYKNSADFRHAIDDLWASLKELWSMLVDALGPSLKDLGGAVIEAGKVLLSALAKPLELAINLLGGLVRGITSVIKWFGAGGDNKAVTSIASDALLADVAVSSLDTNAQSLSNTMGNVANGMTAVGDIEIKSLKNSKEKGKAEKERITDLATIEGMQNKLQDLQQAMLRAKGEERNALAREIALNEQKLDVMKQQVDAVMWMAKHGNKQVAQDGKPIDAVRIGDPKQLAVDIEPAKIKLEFDKGIDMSPLKQIEKQTIESLTAAQKRYDQFIGRIQRGTSSIAGAMQGLGQIIGGSGGAWLEWGANVLQAISQAIPAIISLITGNVAVAASGAAASVGDIPIVGPALAIAAAASVVAALMNIPKPQAFALGGVVSGPTYALVGEYAGAANNPEVIAPLNKLKDLLDDGDDSARTVQFRISRGDLVGVLNHDLKRRRYT